MLPHDDCTTESSRPHAETPHQPGDPVPLTPVDACLLALLETTSDQTQALDTLAEPRVQLALARLMDADRTQYMHVLANLNALYLRTKDIEALLAPHRRRLDAEPGQRRPVVETLSDVEEQPLAWLWWPYLALGHLAMVDGDPGLGKSLFSIALASFLSQNLPLPDQQGKPTLGLGGPFATLILTAEDSLAHVVKRRIRESGGDDTKVHALKGWLGPEDEEKAFTLQHIDVLRAAMDAYRPTLVVIDPIAAYLGGININTSTETRPLMAQLARVAEDYHAVVACIRHPTKPGQNGGGKVIYRGQGNIDLVGAARSAFFVEQHPWHADKVLLCHYKSNHGARGRTQVFSKAEGRFAWCGVSRLTDEMLAGSGRGPEPYALTEACVWLEQALEGGVPKPSKEIVGPEAEEEHGLKRNTLFTAKRKLGVKVSKDPATGLWFWRLPPLEVRQPPPDTVTTLDRLHTLTTLNTSNSSAVSKGYEENTRQSEVYEVFEESKECEVVTVSQGDPPDPAAPSDLAADSELVARLQRFLTTHTQPAPGQFLPLLTLVHAARKWELAQGARARATAELLRPLLARQPGITVRNHGSATRPVWHVVGMTWREPPAPDLCRFTSSEWKAFCAALSAAYDQTETLPDWVQAQVEAWHGEALTAREVWPVLTKMAGAWCEQHPDCCPRCERPRRVQAKDRQRTCETCKHTWTVGYDVWIDEAP